MKQNKSETFVINLDRNKDRFNNISSYLRNNNIDFFRFPAIDGKSNFTDDFLRERNSLRQSNIQFENHVLSKGDVGCANSHYSLYENLIKSDCHNFLILEDDVEISELLNLFLQDFANINLDFDILFLGYFISELNIIHQHCRIPARLKYFGRVKLGSNFILGIPAHGCWTTMGYIVSRKGAEKLIEINKDLMLTADELTSDLYNYGLKIYAVDKPLVFPSSLDFPTETNSIHSVQKLQSVVILKRVWRQILRSTFVLRLKILMRQLSI
jgi:glycosyl transferase family 25